MRFLVLARDEIVKRFVGNLENALYFQSLQSVRDSRILHLAQCTLVVMKAPVPLGQYRELHHGLPASVRAHYALAKLVTDNVAQLVREEMVGDDSRASISRPVNTDKITAEKALVNFSEFYNARRRFGIECL